MLGNGLGNGKSIGVEWIGIVRLLNRGCLFVGVNCVVWDWFVWERNWVLGRNC